MITLVVKKDNKIYYIKDFNGQGLSIKQGENNKFLLQLDDRVEPIAIYDKVENLNFVMLEIIEAIYKECKIIFFPPRDNDFKQEDVVKF